MSEDEVSFKHFRIKFHEREDDCPTVCSYYEEEKPLGSIDVLDKLNQLYEENKNLRKCINAIYIISSRESVE